MNPKPILFSLNKIYIFIIGFLVGGIVVFFLGDFVPKTIINNTTVNVKKTDTLNQPKKEQKHVAYNKNEHKNDKSAVRLVTEKISDSIPDSITVYVKDTTNLNITKENKTEEDVIDRERLIKVVTLPVDGIINESSDTSYQAKLANKMGEETAFQPELRLEFWQSPIGFSGYKLNKSILVLYGLSSEKNINLSYQGNGNLKMEINGNFITLRKTEEFKPLNFQ